MASSSSAPPNNIDDLIRYLPLYQAVLRGDLDSVKNSRHSYAASISANMDTTLHVAVGIGRANHIVDYLLTQMSTQQVGITNNDGNTALSVAAIVGNVQAAEMLLKRHPELCGVANNCGWIPVILAARHAHKDMIETLLEATNRANIPLEKYAIGVSGALFVNLLILSGFYDLALYHVKRYPEVASEGLYGGDNSLLSAIARKPSAFLSGKPFNFWQRFIYHCIPNFIVDIPLVLEFKETGGIWSCIASLQTLFTLVWFTDQENHSLFHLAVMNRQEKVFNLIFQMSNSKDLLLMSQDTYGNNILHLAGGLAPQHRLNLISGAALKMQHELKWFKEVEKTVRPTEKNDKNSEGKTPAMVFTEAHKELVKEGEKWMKDTASSCSLVAALIATVVFAAAITVPGGNINDKGHPVFLKDAAFIRFGISDVFCLFSSVAALLIFLSILTARYAEDDFLYALPKKLICGLVFLFLSITTMMVAFSATVFLVFCGEQAWMLIPVGVLACLPVSLFASLQFPLLVDMIYSTYGSGNFGRQSKRVLY